MFTHSAAIGCMLHHSNVDSSSLVSLLFAENNWHALHLCWQLPNSARSFPRAGFGRICKRRPDVIPVTDGAEIRYIHDEILFCIMMACVCSCVYIAELAQQFYTRSTDFTHGTAVATKWSIEHHIGFSLKYTSSCAYWYITDHVGSWQITLNNVSSMMPQYWLHQYPSIWIDLV